MNETKANRLHLVPSESSAARGDPTGGKGGSGLMNITIPIALAPQFIELANCIIESTRNIPKPKITKRTLSDRARSFQRNLKKSFKLVDEGFALHDVFASTGIPVQTLEYHLKKREKLFSKKVLEKRNRSICRMYLNGKKTVDIASHFGLSVSTISNITKSVR